MFHTSALSQGLTTGQRRQRVLDLLNPTAA